MRTIAIPIRLLIAFLVMIRALRGDDDAPVPLPDRILSLQLPLILGNGDASIGDVPMRWHRGGESELGDSMSAPVYATSGRESDRITDINLISSSGIKVSLKKLAKAGEFKPGADIDMIIDVSRFKQPKNIRMKAPAVVEAILACMRSESPAGFRGKVNVKIVGAADASEYSKMEGPLWSSGQMEPDHGEPTRDEGDSHVLGSLHVPLITPDEGVCIRAVPVKYGFEARHAFIRPFGAPVYAVSAVEADRKADINVVSLAKIGVSLEYVKPDGWMMVGAESNLVIDLSHFIQPKNVKMEIYDIVQAMLTALRMNIPASSDGMINVRIVGARDPSQFAALEGPLWRSGYQKPEGK